MPKSVESRVSALEKRGTADYIEAVMSQMTVEELEELVVALEAIRNKEGGPIAEPTQPLTQADERRLAEGLKGMVLAWREQKRLRGRLPKILLSLPCKAALK